MARITVARKSGLVLRGGSMRRKTTWVGLGESNVVLAAASSAAILNAGGAGVLALRPFTIVRTHITWFLKSDQTAALEIQQAAFGLVVVSDQAAGIGITAVPTPFSEIDSDVFQAYGFIMQSFTFVTGSGIQTPGGTMAVIDSRGMRKVEQGTQIITVAENSTASAGTQILAAGRVLVKLH